MKTIDALVDKGDPALPLLQSWIAQAGVRCELLPPSEERQRILLELQVTTHSLLGTAAYETGGLLVDHGWLRILGSGHPALLRNLVDWNEDRSASFLLVADDVIGGFFALNGGAFGDDIGSVFYWAPDSLEWEACGFGYSSFVEWAMSGALKQFYAGHYWEGWEAEVGAVHGDKCYNFVPPLFLSTQPPSPRSRRLISVAEQYAVNMSFSEQLSDPPEAG
ncbi:DUF2625 family protein [Massilia sp. CF038]|uniref:DUF2625 family protein n=1 Tax=Massilia sp. CF038 TaxID=1881045 RepID=UPI00091E102F|nr:DUF2625 family protein [Massilia sp. CF038]SHH24227.1 Protein of unknown function DUF2625 [Massilia sp. CF038]